MAERPDALSFRHLEPGDAEVVHRLHGDPATNRHNPYGASADLAASQRTLDGWLAHGERHGFGFELAFSGDELAGIGGVRWDEWRGQPVLNLYWRLLPEFQGRGWSAVLAARAVTMARSHPELADDLLVARMLPDNVASARVAERVGLLRRADLDGALDGVRWILYADRRS